MSSFEDTLRARRGEVVQPAFKKDAFNCIHCAAYAEQSWAKFSQHLPIWHCRCNRCHAVSYWRATTGNDGELIYPRRSTAPGPHPEMPEDVRADYREAASIADLSPRGAGALLRLALQKLMPHLGEQGKSLDSDIGSLVAKGLAPEVQQALDALRVIGNNAVHPLELDLSEDRETVGALFDLLNYIVEERISRPGRLATIYSQLPEGAREAIERRDAK